MLKNRLIYAIIVATALAFYIVYSPWFSWYLLLLVVLLAPLDLLVSLPGILSKSIKLTAPSFLNQDASGVLSITVEHKKSSPVRCLYVRLRVTGDDFAVSCNVITPASDVSRSEVAIDSTQTGLTVFEVNRVYTISLLGLFSRRIKTDSKASVLVLPPPRKPSNSIELPRSLILRPKYGGGFSEDHEMRVYQPGDPVRSIHWKLSAKFDSLIIREPMIPLRQSRLVHIMPWESAEERDNTLAKLRWVCLYLINRELTFFVKFGDLQLTEEISDEAELVNFLRRVLDKDAAVKPATHPRITRFSWIYKVDGK